MNNGSSAGDLAPTHHQRVVAALLDGILASGLMAFLSGVPLLGGLAGGAYLMARDGIEVGPLRFRSVGKYMMAWPSCVSTNALSPWKRRCSETGCSG